MRRSRHQARACCSVTSSAYGARGTCVAEPHAPSAWEGHFAHSIRHLAIRSGRGTGWRVGANSVGAELKHRLAPAGWSNTTGRRWALKTARTSAVLLNLQHSFEMLLKAGLVHRGVRGGKLPAHDPPAVDVDHEAQEDRALPAAQVGEVRDPELVRPRGGSPVARRA